MTQLNIVPNYDKKTARIVGVIAAGEFVGVKISDFDGPVEGLCLRILHGIETIARFPNADGDAWTKSGSELSCIIDLNTFEARRLLRWTQETSCLFCLEDRKSQVLYFTEEHEIGGWPSTRSDDKLVSVRDCEDRLDKLIHDLQILRQDLNSHCGDTDNPHIVVKEEIGLGKVDNTADAEKPVSNPQREAINSVLTALNAEISRSAKDDAALSRSIFDETQRAGAEERRISGIISEEVDRATTEDARLRALILAVKQLDIVIADALPIAGPDYARKLYFVPSKNPDADNIKDEFICIEHDGVWNWEQIGSTAITIEFDERPIEGSMNAVRSGGIFSYIRDKLKNILLPWANIQDKPQINGVTLTGNKTAAEINILSTDNVADTVEENGEKVVKAKGIWKFVKSLLPSWLNGDKISIFDNPDGSQVKKAVFVEPGAVGIYDREKDAESNVMIWLGRSPENPDCDIFAAKMHPDGHQIVGREFYLPQSSGVLLSAPKWSPESRMTCVESPNILIDVIYDHRYNEYIVNVHKSPDDYDGFHETNDDNPRFEFYRNVGGVRSVAFIFRKMPTPGEASFGGEFVAGENYEAWFPDGFSPIIAIGVTDAEKGLDDVLNDWYTDNKLKIATNSISGADSRNKEANPNSVVGRLNTIEAQPYLTTVDGHPAIVIH